MEDGRVIDSTAARQTHPALTSVHLDTNKKSDLFPGTQLRGETIVARRLDDIRIPMTLLSRFDFIVDIPRDARRQMDVALAMYGRQEASVGSPSGEQTPTDWARKLQVLVAYLRSKHARIPFPPAITAAMQDKHAALRHDNDPLLEELPWLSDLQSRLANSAFKYVAAYARLNHRPSPTEEDVDRAFRLIWRKFEFLATLARQLRNPNTWAAPREHDVDAWLQSRFAGRQVRTKEVLDAYRQDVGLEPIRRTIERHLPMVARPGAHQGLWVFPPAPPEGEASP
jgi:hypothetical protein